MDFDNTITIGEVSLALLREFADGDWYEPYFLHVTGEITLEELMRRQFAMIRCSKEELVRFVRDTTVVRPGFDGFVRFCNDREVPVAVCSAGMDFYVEAVLSALDIPSVQLVVGETTFGTDGIRVRYPEGVGGLDFKATFVKRKGEAGYHVIHIGDGISDHGAAEEAGFVFARDGLLEFCRRSSLPHLPFDDFRDVRRGLESLLTGARP